MLAPRELRRWIDALPMGNPPRSVHMLSQQLRLLVRDPQPGNRFSSLLEIYEEPVERLLEIVDERLQGSAGSVVPLDQLEYALVELLSELAFGQLRAANDMLVRGKQPTSETLYRAARLLDDAMHIERLHYCRLLPETWRPFLQIYRHAEVQQVHREAVGVARRRPDQPVTVEALFFRALIISLCDPHQYGPGDIVRWHQWMTRHTDLVALGILPQGPFSIPVDLSGELAPLTSARRGKPGPEMRYLDADRLLGRLEEDPSAPKELGAALTDLIKGRKSPEQRQSPRQPRDHPFQMTYGLRNIHARLETLTQGIEESGAPPAAVGCRQINQSKSGSAFQLQGPLNPPLTIGEPLLFEAEHRTGGGAAVGFAGQIRRVVALDDQGIEIGVEKLRGRLIPLTISGTAAERARGNTQALLRQSIDDDEYTLLANRMLYREGEKLTAEGPSCNYSLRIKGLLGVVQQTAFIDVEVTET
jgi:hypothetical protein